MSNPRRNRHRSRSANQSARTRSPRSSIGEPFKTLKRHLASHGLGFSAYRERYGLPSDHPSVALNYSAMRSATAKSIGLGSRGKLVGKTAAPEASPMAAPRKPKRAARSQKSTELA